MPTFTIEQVEELKTIFVEYMDGPVQADTFTAAYLNEKLSWKKLYAADNFVDEAGKFVRAFAKKGRAADVVQALAAYISEDAPDRSDLIERLQRLLSDEGANKKLSVYISMNDLDDDLLDINDVRDSFAGDFQQYEFVVLAGNLSERERSERLSKADVFAALLTANYIDSGVLESELDKMIQLARLKPAARGASFVAFTANAPAKAFWQQKAADLGIRDDLRFKEVPLAGGDSTADTSGPEEARPSSAVVERRVTAHPEFVITLGEPKKSMESGLALSLSDLRARLAEKSVPTEHWEDGWRNSVGTKDVLGRLPVFVRSIADKAAKPADVDATLMAQLKCHFGWDFDDSDPDELSRCLRILWRPGGPHWEASNRLPREALRTGEAGELAEVLASLVGSHPTNRNIINWEAPVEQTASAGAILKAVENCLRLIGGEPEPARQMFTKKDNLAEKLMPLIGAFRPIIAITDMEEPVDPWKALERIRKFEERLPAKMKDADSGLLCVAILVRNAEFFLGSEISGGGLSRAWSILRLKQDDTSTYVPDKTSVDFVRARVTGVLQ